MILHICISLQLSFILLICILFLSLILIVTILTESLPFNDRNMVVFYQKMYIHILLQKPNKHPHWVLMPNFWLPVTWEYMVPLLFHTAQQKSSFLHWYDFSYLYKIVQIPCGFKAQNDKIVWVFVNNYHVCKYLLSFILVCMCYEFIFM